jgi:hypothetical protein
VCQVLSQPISLPPTEFSVLVHFSLLLVFLLDWSAPHAWISFSAAARSRREQVLSVSFLQ